MGLFQRVAGDLTVLFSDAFGGAVYTGITAVTGTKILRVLNSIS